MRFFIASLIAALIVFNCKAQEKTITNTFTGVSDISLNTGSGDCSLQKGTGNAVEVTVTHTYGDDFEAKMKMSGSKLVLEEKFHAGSMRGTSRWVITMPDNIGFDFNTGSGDLDISDLIIELDGNSGSGDVDLRKVTGEFDMNTGSGDYTMSGLNGEFKFNTGSGDIRIQDSEGTYRGNTGSGDIKMDYVKCESRMNTGSGDVRIDEFKASGPSRFNSGSGDVTVELGSELEYDINLNSGSGDAVLDFNGHKIEGVITMKTKKRGGEIIAPFEFDKVEEIDEGGQTYVLKSVKLGSREIDIRVTSGTGDAMIKE